MALARIITCSDACAHELARELRVRGYTVEIVSPDKVPDNFADLELRVDAGSGNRLIASVEAHDGKRSASFEFIHHFQAPVGDFVERAPKPRQTRQLTENPLVVNAEPSIENTALPSALPPPPSGTLSAADEALPKPEYDQQAVAYGISSLDNLLSLPGEPLIQNAERNSNTAQATIQPISAPPTIVRLTKEPRSLHRPAGWFWRAGLTFAGVMLLAMVLGLGVRRGGKASAQNFGVVSGEAPGQQPTDVIWFNSLGSEKDERKDPEKKQGQIAAASAPQPALESQVATTNTATGAITAATSPRAMVSGRVSRRNDDDLIAPDTTTYFDQQTGENAAARAKLANKDSVRRHPSSHKRRRHHRTSVS